MARKESLKWEYHLHQVLLTKPSEVVQEACQVLEKHGCSVKELKTELRTYTIVAHFAQFADMVEACATALNQMGMLLSNHVARWVHCSEMFLPRGSLSVTKTVAFNLQQT